MGAGKTLKTKSFSEFSHRPTVRSIAKVSQLSRLAVLGNGRERDSGDSIGFNVK